MEAEFSRRRVLLSGWGSLSGARARSRNGTEIRIRCCRHHEVAIRLPIDKRHVELASENFRNDLISEKFGTRFVIRLSPKNCVKEMVVNNWEKNIKFYHLKIVFFKTQKSYFSPFKYKSI